MSTRQIAYRRYDTAVKEAVARSRNPNLFPELRIPRSTALYWIKGGVDRNYERPARDGAASPQGDVFQYRPPRVVSFETSTGSLLLETFKEVYALFGFSLKLKHLRDRAKKAEVMRLVDKLRHELPLKRCLQELGISNSRWTRWKKELKVCRVSATSYCTRLSSRQLTRSEVEEMRKLVESPEYSHFSVRSLHWHAQRIKKVFCSYSTWLKYVREFRWRRARNRKFTCRPKIGVRAAGPNRIWHLDLTKVRLLDGTRAYLQAVIDNASRYVLAWHIGADYGGLQTASLLREAMEEAFRLHPKKEVPEVYMDSGRENINHHVRQLERQNFIRMVQAQLDVRQSNSMIEALFRSLKHQHLHYRALRDIKSLTSEATFYLREHNERMPHSALKGATPVEIYLGSWTSEDQAQLQKERQEAAAERIRTNRAAQCAACPE